MKLRFLIYGSLLVVALVLPIVYNTMDRTIQKQEINIRNQKENWYDKMANIEFDLAKSATDKDSFWFHYGKGCNYFLLELAMIREDLTAVVNTL